jgi:hypothetical protein
MQPTFILQEEESRKEKGYVVSVRPMVSVLMKTDLIRNAKAPQKLDPDV